MVSSASDILQFPSFRYCPAFRVKVLMKCHKQSEALKPKTWEIALICGGWHFHIVFLKLSWKSHKYSSLVLSGPPVPASKRMQASGNQITWHEPMIANSHRCCLSVLKVESIKSSSTRHKATTCLATGVTVPNPNGLTCL